MGYLQLALTFSLTKNLAVAKVSISKTMVERLYYRQMGVFIKSSTEYPPASWRVFSDLPIGEAKVLDVELP